jgi:hypothetical protein
MNIKETIVKEATEVREWAMKKSVWFDNDSDLCGWCAICSTAIFKRLYNKGLNPTFVEAYFSDLRNSEAHCFIICKGYLVDVTATQFSPSYDPVIVRKYDDSDGKKWFWKKQNEAKTIGAIRSMLKEWDDDQHPSL